jgi:hypothetical protein
MEQDHESEVYKNHFIMKIKKNTSSVNLIG